MRIALEEAQAAAARGETPVGAVIADPVTGEVIARAGNGPIGAHDPTAHIAQGSSVTTRVRPVSR